jgi:hypothetical protein
MIKKELVITLLAMGLLSVGCAAPRGGGGGGGGGGDDDDSQATDDDDDAAPNYYGPENQWWHALVDDVPTEFENVGRNVGQTPPNFTLTDQFGDEVELYQFWGQVIMLDIFAFW